MDCLKSQNQCINTVMFPGAYTPSSFNAETFKGSHNLRLLYIPFRKKDCSSFSYMFSAPQHIPVLLAINPNAAVTNLFCLHFHGNACDIGQISICAQRESQAFNAHYLLVEYPGFGISSGYANEVVMDEVAQIVYDFVIEELKIPHSQIVLIGRSIGTGPSCRLASKLQLNQHPPAAVILQSPFTSIRDAAGDLLGCISFFMLDRWPNWSTLVGRDNSVIRCPVLFIHADCDKVIRFSHSQIMHNERLQCGLPSELFVQRSTEKFTKGHNFFDYDRDVVQPGRDFLQRMIANNKNTRFGALHLPITALELAQIVPLEYVVWSPSIDSNDSNKSSSRALNSNIMSSDGTTPSASIKPRSKCDRWVYMSWCCCPCLFCTEGFVACSIGCCFEALIYTGIYTPAVDYKRMKPKALRQGTIFNLLMRRKSFERLITEEEAKNRGNIEVINPLNTSSQSQQRLDAVNRIKSRPLLASSSSRADVIVEDYPEATIIIRKPPVPVAAKIHEDGDEKTLDFVPG